MESRTREGEGEVCVIKAVAEALEQVMTAMEDSVNDYQSLCLLVLRLLQQVYH